MPIIPQAHIPVQQSSRSQYVDKYHHETWERAENRWAYANIIQHLGVPWCPMEPHGVHGVP